MRDSVPTAPGHGIGGVSWLLRIALSNKPGRDPVASANAGNGTTLIFISLAASHFDGRPGANPVTAAGRHIKQKLGAEKDWITAKSFAGHASTRLIN